MNILRSNPRILMDPIQFQINSKYKGITYFWPCIKHLQKKEKV